MPTYITLFRYTQQGKQNIKDMPTRLEQNKQLLSRLGAELKGFYLTMGQYDAVAIGEFPDEETAARAALIVGLGGAVTTETLRAFTEEEAVNIVRSLP